MTNEVKAFTVDFTAVALQLFAAPVETLSVKQQYRALAALVRRDYAVAWARTKAAEDRGGRKQVYYFSIEFLPGRLLASNLLNLGIKTTVDSGLHELGLDPAAIYAAEPEPALGNGGLGRLGSAFLDAMASTGMAGHGNGIRYQYGLFKQRFVDGYQVELPDDWLREPNVWETRQDDRAVIVKFGGEVTMRPGPTGRLVAHYTNTEDVLAVPYDTGIVGYRTDMVNTMRLWAAEPVPGAAFSLTEKERIAAITQVLYPDDSQESGRELRLRQEYFFVAAGVASIVRHYLRDHRDLLRLPAFVAIHINDTYPAMAIPELMRLLLDDYGLTWDQAWGVVVATMSYTNHTLLAEALESWDWGLFNRTLPRIAQLIAEIDRRFRAQYDPRFGQLLVDRTAPLADGRVRMAYLAALGSHRVNGVSELHSTILRESLLRDMATIFPDRFVNETNGITLRRWVMLADPGLAALLDRETDRRWRRSPRALMSLARQPAATSLLTSLGAVKLANKTALAEYIHQETGLVVDPQAQFDVQIKRLHAYKRQLLHLLGILADYLMLKDGQRVLPRVHIFGAKAAPSYSYAKAIIKVINAAADLINGDSGIAGQLQVVFLPNYNVALAERIVPAADVSEQISLAGKEASGTSNMKMMANGAVTLATLDGANLEIRDAVGAANIATFGLTAEQVIAHQEAHDYQAAAVAASDPLLQRVLAMLTDGTIPGISLEGRVIVDSLLAENDEYFVLADFAAYQAAKKLLAERYADPSTWQRMSLANIAASGRFAADYTVAGYGQEIWGIRPQRPAE